MKSIQLLLQPHLFPRKHLPQLHSFSSNNGGTLRLDNESRFRRTKAVSGVGDRAVVLTLFSVKEKSPEEITSFVLVSVLLIGMYFLTNFVVPGLMMKSFDTDTVNENQFDDDDDEDDDDES